MASASNEDAPDQVNDIARENAKILLETAEDLARAARDSADIETALRTLQRLQRASPIKGELEHAHRTIRKAAEQRMDELKKEANHIVTASLTGQEYVRLSNNDILERIESMKASKIALQRLGRSDADLCCINDCLETAIEDYWWPWYPRVW